MNMEDNEAAAGGRTGVAPAPSASPVISAVVCTFSRYDLLRQAVESLRRQTLDPSRYEILVIDNSPNAEFSASAAEYVAVRNLRWIIEKVSGEANARNVALAHVNSPIVAYLDDDAIACPEWLDAMLAAFATGEDVVAVGGRVNPIWGSPQPAWLHDHLLGLLSVLDWGSELRPIEWGEWLVAANLAFRVAPLKKAGGFATHLGRRAGERVLLSNCEMDVIDALRRAGYRALYSPVASVDHLIHPQRLSQTWMRRRVVWQAISDHLQNPEAHLGSARAAQSRLATLLRGNPDTGSLTGPTDDAWRFTEQMEALKHLTHAMLAGFDDSGSSGEAPDGVQFRITTGNIDRGAVATRRPSAPVPPAADARAQPPAGQRPPAPPLATPESAVECAGFDIVPEEVLSNLGEFDVPHHVFLPKGMLVPGEQQLLYRLACHYYSGTGAIIDAGAFCGASAYALAAGVSDNSRSFPKHGLVHSYDIFLAEDEYTRNYLENIFFNRFSENGERIELIRPIAPGESFFDVFSFQTQRYESLIQVHAGSILDETWWSGEPVEILFIDVCKTLEIQNHLLAQFLPELVPGRSIVIQQDFHHPWHPYIHVVMEYLDPYFEIIVSAVGGSRAYRLRSPLPQNALDKSVRYDFTAEQTIRLLEQTVRKAPAGERPTLSAVLARQLFLLGQKERCRDAIVGILSGLQPGDRSYFETLFGNLCPGVYRPEEHGTPGR